MEPGHRALEDSTFAERYELGAPVGTGGMGVVHRAHDRRLKREVAIKFLRTSLLEHEQTRLRFLKEARLCAAIRHPAVVHIYEADVAAGVPYIVTELVEGRTLAEVIKGRGKLPQEEWVPIAVQILEGLGAIHAGQIVHRDLKPGNVLVSVELPPVAKIADFGIAKALHDDAVMDMEGMMRTSTGAVLGTPEYMAPEQVTGDPVSPATDLYALGLLIHRMATGALVFGGTNMMEVLRQQAHAEPQFGPDLAPEVCALLSRLLQKAPESRPGPAQIREALDLIEVGGRDRVDIPPEGSRKTVRRPVRPTRQQPGLGAALPPPSDAAATRARSWTSPALAALALTLTALWVWLPRGGAPGTGPGSLQTLTRFAEESSSAPEPRELFAELTAHPDLCRLSLRQIAGSTKAQVVDLALVRMLEGVLAGPSPLAQPPVSPAGPATPDTRSSPARSAPPGAQTDPSPAQSSPPLTQPAPSPAESAASLAQQDGSVDALVVALREALATQPLDARAAGLALEGFLRAGERVPASDAGRLHPGNAVAWARELMRLRDAEDLGELVLALRRLQIAERLHPGTRLAELTGGLLKETLSGGAMVRREGPLAAARSLEGLVQSTATEMLRRWVRGPRARADAARLQRALVLSAIILRVISKDSGVEWTDRWEVPVRVHLDRVRRLQPQTAADLERELGGSGVLEVGSDCSSGALQALAAAFDVNTSVR